MSQRKEETLQQKVVSQLEEAQKRVLAFEKQVVVKAKAQRRELEQLVSRIQSGKELKAIGRQANAAKHEVGKRLDGLQRQLTAAVGVASQAQVAQINKELARLTRKVDALLKKPTASA